MVDDGECLNEPWANDEAAEDGPGPAPRRSRPREAGTVQHPGTISSGACLDDPLS